MKPRGNVHEPCLQLSGYPYNKVLYLYYTSALLTKAPGALAYCFEHIYFSGVFFFLAI